jgi:hypothetical protein
MSIEPRPDEEDFGEASLDPEMINAWTDPLETDEPARVA